MIILFRLPRAGITGVYHYAWFCCYFFTFPLVGQVCSYGSHLLQDDSLVGTVHRINEEIKISKGIATPR
jgi:hypothetical protein